MIHFHPVSSTQGAEATHKPRKLSDGRTSLGKWLGYPDSSARVAIKQHNLNIFLSKDFEWSASKGSGGLWIWTQSITFDTNSGIVVGYGYNGTQELEDLRRTEPESVKNVKLTLLVRNCDHPNYTFTSQYDKEVNLAYPGGLNSSISEYNRVRNQPETRPAA